MNIPKSNFAIWMPMKPLDISQILGLIWKTNSAAYVFSVTELSDMISFEHLIWCLFQRIIYLFWSSRFLQSTPTEYAPILMLHKEKRKDGENI